MDIEKQSIDPKNALHYFKPKWLLIIFCSLILSAYRLGGNFSYKIRQPVTYNIDTDDEPLCPISKKLIPIEFQTGNFQNNLKKILKDPLFRNQSAAKLGGAVQIPTEIQDNWLDVSEDHFLMFGKLHEYLKKTFPLIHNRLKVEKINKYGLVYTWEGSNKALKPILLSAHQDVVPVELETVNEWIYPPFSGHFDGQYVWGRGSSDCKDLLIALLETIEFLLDDESFVPRRTIVLGFGFDEEASGTLGAFQINKFLSDRYGSGESFYAIIDEGSAGVQAIDDLFIASIATGEKGYVDNVIKLKTPGGHSSIPPKHTSIGIISKLVLMVEDHPFSASISSKNPFLGYLTCYAENSKTIDDKVKYNILHSEVDESANLELVKYLEKNKETEYLVKTSVATDIIRGGIKSNALPESVEVLFNSRISVESSVKEVTDAFSENILAIANRFDLGFIREGEVLKEITEFGYFNYTFMDPLEVAPVSPWKNSEVWDIYAGTLRHFYEDVGFKDLFAGDAKLIVVPTISTGNTDTKNYWELTSNIFRYAPSIIFEEGENPEEGLHSVNEKSNIDGHLSIIAFYYEYLHNLNFYSET